MCQQTLGNGGQAVQTFEQGIVKNGSPAAQSLLHHPVFISKVLLQQAGPAFLLTEPASGLRTVAMRIGVAKSDNGLFHLSLLHIGYLTAILHQSVPVLNIRSAYHFFVSSTALRIS